MTIVLGEFKGKRARMLEVSDELSFVHASISHVNISQVTTKVAVYVSGVVFFLSLRYFIVLGGV